LIDVNDKDFVAIPDKNRAAAAGGEHSTNMYLNDRFVHRVDGTDGRTKNKPLPNARTSLAARAEMVVSGDRRLPNTAGKLPALPRSSRRTESARDLLLVFFESTLHVSPDQQLSALQPLTK
jgi:hypothetical protein